MLGPHPIDVLSSDHHTVKPWLSSQLPFYPVPELAQQGDSLLGARVDYLGSNRVAALVYQHGHHQINVYVWPRDAVAVAPPRDGAIDGYHLTTARVGSFIAVVVSDIEHQRNWQRFAIAGARHASAADPGEH